MSLTVNTEDNSRDFITNALLIISLIAGTFTLLAGDFGYAMQQETDTISYAGQDAELSIVQVTDRTFELQLSPIGPDGNPTESPDSEILIDYSRTPIWSGRSIEGMEELEVGDLTVELQSSPLRVAIRRDDDTIVQEFSWPDDETGSMEFRTDARVYGMGEGGAQEDFDRRGHLHSMRDGNASFERATHGAYIAVPMFIGADGWSMFVHHPMDRGNQFDLRNGQGVFIPDEDVLDQPVRLLLTAWDEPEQVLSEYRIYAGPSPLPPLWALGYMQSHRTLSGSDEIRWVARNFRSRRLPVDAVIYLGTGFTPTGWNTGHGSFEFNDVVFDDPPGIIRDLHDSNLKVVLHNYNPPRGLHGYTLEEMSDDSSHIRNYWGQHRPVVDLGVDGWWPDGGEGLSSEARLTRHRMYWIGSLNENPNLRPWSLHRTGYSGVHRYGGWIWSGDPDSRWETLRMHIQIGLNHSLSLSPYWGSDIAAFVPTDELTGELYIRWFQFAAFTPSFRAHGRTWHLRLPWGWNRGHIGPPESAMFDSEEGYPWPEELRNALIEPIARQFLHLRYRLLPYNYTLTREAHDTGLPPMRAMWLHYPDDERAAGLGDQYLWGRDLLVAPVYTQGATERTVYLPDGLWYDFWTNERHEGGQEITRQVDLGTLPLYVRSGAILPLDPVRQYTAQEVDEPTVFQIYSGADGQYRWYRDDGESMNYQNGEYSWTRLTWNDDQRQLTIIPDPDSDGQSPDPVTLQIVIIDPETSLNTTQTINWPGNRTRITFP